VLAWAALPHAPPYTSHARHTKEAGNALRFKTKTSMHTMFAR